jgi:hypothetical protein
MLEIVLAIVLMVSLQLYKCRRNGVLPRSMQAEEEANVSRREVWCAILMKIWFRPSYMQEYANNRFGGESMNVNSPCIRRSEQKNDAQWVVWAILVSETLRC